MDLLISPIVLQAGDTRIIVSWWGKIYDPLLLAIVKSADNFSEVSLAASVLDPNLASVYCECRMPWGIKF